MIRAYLAKEHVDGVETGCPMAALGSEMPRQSPKVRRAATRRIKEVIDLVARHSPDEGGAGAYEQALVTVAAMVGTLMLARAVDDLHETAVRLAQDEAELRAAEAERDRLEARALDVLAHGLARERLPIVGRVAVGAREAVHIGSAEAHRLRSRGEIVGAQRHHTKLQDAPLPLRARARSAEGGVDTVSFGAYHRGEPQLGPDGSPHAALIE